MNIPLVFFLVMTSHTWAYQAEAIAMYEHPIPFYTQDDCNTAGAAWIAGRENTRSFTCIQQRKSDIESWTGHAFTR